MMADTKHTTAALKLSGHVKTELYTVGPRIGSTVLHSCQVANTEDDSIEVTVEYYQASTSLGFTIIKKATVPVGAALNVLSDALHLNTGDRILVSLEVAADATDNTPASADIVASLTEYESEDSDGGLYNG